MWVCFCVSTVVFCNLEAVTPLPVQHGCVSTCFVVALNKGGFGLGSMCMLMGDAASRLVDLGFLTEKSRPMGTMLMCELLCGVKSSMYLGVTLS